MSLNYQTVTGTAVNVPSCILICPSPYFSRNSSMNFCSFSFNILKSANISSLAVFISFNCSDTKYSSVAIVPIFAL